MKNFATMSALSKDVSQFGRLNLPDSALKGVIGKNLTSSAFDNWVC